MRFFYEAALQNDFVLPYLGFYISLQFLECDFLYILITQM